MARRRGGRPDPGRREDPLREVGSPVIRSKPRGARRDRSPPGTIVGRVFAVLERPGEVGSPDRGLLESCRAGAFGMAPEYRRRRRDRLRDRELQRATLDRGGDLRCEPPDLSGRQLGGSGRRFSVAAGRLEAGGSARATGRPCRVRRDVVSARRRRGVDERRGRFVGCARSARAGRAPTGDRGEALGNVLHPARSGRLEHDGARHDRTGEGARLRCRRGERRSLLREGPGPSLPAEAEDRRRHAGSEGGSGAELRTGRGARFLGRSGPGAAGGPWRVRSAFRHDQGRGQDRQ